ncbi:hypothetical protein NEUTE1DRAFT_57720 [Neurospora tetrasperma FGSC 2508]|uniref:Thioesterase domain-containing protein n=1 Tax=Neurospora tetrasperma (strain FGSC 2508 / ATCC MYA-4615 / P0657) TaxID=510951 RepID=F8MEU0_NEUT8|nr:uncharacterized protein NEUTE1DRAFT_57720 [Neurospora tetrasperma FGSC 2508]EGO60864.1 hypothetical protein NEUTE1DRAFT_57720 [Neurospora tetrasperma FGSC 2508]EGZ75144.1 hypothetical protein NEUTE2DRAFT_104553 [Neurospora tetrasperma FGSC 2509]
MADTSTIAGGDIPPASQTQAEVQDQTTKSSSDSQQPSISLEKETLSFTPSLSTSILLPLTPTTSSALALAHVQRVWDSIRPNSAIYNLLLSDIVLVAAVSHPTGRILAHLTLKPIHLNSKRILHGAVSGTLCDWAGGMAIAASIAGDELKVGEGEQDRQMTTGVSTDMHLSYCSTAREGDTLEVEAWVSRRGRKLGFTGLEIRKRVDGWEKGEKGEVVVVGSHTKYLPFGQKPREAKE